MFNETIDFTLALILGGISAVASIALGVAVYFVAEGDRKRHEERALTREHRRSRS